MKKVIADLSWKNWNKKPGNVLTTIAVGLGVLGTLKSGFLALVHRAPFHIPETFDLWVIWLLDVAVWVSAALMLFTRKKDIDVGLKIKDETTPGNQGITSLGQNKTRP